MQARSTHLCECGCGQPTNLVTHTDCNRGVSKGEPWRFLPGHHQRMSRPVGPAHHRWKGGRVLRGGYVLIRRPDHPRADSRGYVKEHILEVEKALGKFLPPGVEVHHVDEDKAHNRHANLVACQDHSYHSLLHVRRRALLACGHADWRQCYFCHSWAATDELIPGGNGSMAHRLCRNAARRNRSARSRCA
jgi:hypothetical protein